MLLELLLLIAPENSRKLIVLNGLLGEFRSLVQSVVNTSSLIFQSYVLFEVMYINYKQMLGDKMNMVHK